MSQFTIEVPSTLGDQPGQEAAFIIHLSTDSTNLEALRHYAQSGETLDVEMNGRDTEGRLVFIDDAFTVREDGETEDAIVFSFYSA